MATSSTATATSWKSGSNGPRFLSVGQVAVGTVTATAVACLSNPDAVDEFFRACRKGRVAALPEWLSSSGEDCLSWSNSLGQGCIEVACLGGGGNVKMVEALLEAGAPIRENLLTETWPLHCAAFHGTVEMVTVLVRYGGFGQLYAPNRFNELPLHFACMAGSKRIVEKLLEVERQHRSDLANEPFFSSVQLETRCARGLTPADVAKEYGHKELVAILQPGHGHAAHHQDHGAHA